MSGSQSLTPCSLLQSSGSDPWTNSATSDYALKALRPVQPGIPVVGTLALSCLNLDGA